MRRTLSALRGIERDLARLEEAAEGAGEISPAKQIELIHDALYDATAAAKLESLHAAGQIVPFLYRLYQLETMGPCYGAGKCTTCETHRISDAPPRKEQR